MAETVFSAGIGTEDDPYLIETADDFIAFATSIKNGEKFAGKYFAQTEDIALGSSYTGLLNENLFHGVYDGQGHTIDTNITGLANTGVFGRIDGGGVLINVGFTGSMSGSDNIAPIRTLGAGGKVINCYSTMTVSGGTTTNDAAGGLINWLEGLAQNCWFGGKVTGNKAYAIAPRKANTVTASSIVDCYYLSGSAATGGTIIGTATEVAAADVATLADTLNANVQLMLLLDDTYALKAWQNDGNNKPVLSAGNSEPLEIPFAGSGTKDEPYQIQSNDDFLTFAALIGDGYTFDGKYLIQTADIDLKDTYAGGSDADIFSGIYDGQGYSINAALVNSTSKVPTGIFGVVGSGTIMNLGFIGSLEDTTGTIGLSPIRKVVSGARVINCYSTMTVSGGARNAGLVDHAEGVTIENCWFGGSVTAGSLGGYALLAYPKRGTNRIENGYYLEGGAPNGVKNLTTGYASVTAAEAAVLAETLNFNGTILGLDAAMPLPMLWTTENGMPVLTNTRQAASDVARKVEEMYIFIDQVARTVTNGYIFVDGVAREFFSNTES